MKTAWKLLLIYTLFVIVWGAFVRASGSGDGCGAHWPSCHGDFLLEAASGKTWIEYLHRASSGLYGIFVLVLFGLSFFNKKYSLSIRLFALAVFALTVLESLIGAKLVLSELVGKNTSFARAVVVMIHLTNTLLLVFCNTAVVYLLDSYKNQKFSLAVLKKWSPVFALFFLTGASGALAALGDSLYPSESLMEGFAMDFNASSPLIIKLRSLHPLFAFSLSFIVIYLTDAKKDYGLLLISFALSTLILGLINLMLLAPIYMQLVHLSSALTFWILCIFYCFRLSEEKSPKLIS